MECQNLFSEKSKKNISICHLLKIIPRVLSIKSTKVRPGKMPSSLICAKTCEKALIASLVNGDPDQTACMNHCSGCKHNQKYHIYPKYSDTLTP